MPRVNWKLITDRLSAETFELGIDHARIRAPDLYIEVDGYKRVERHITTRCRFCGVEGVGDTCSHCGAPR